MSSLGGTSSTYWFCTIDSTSVKSRSCSYVAPLSVPLLATEPPSERVSTTSKEPITNAFFMESPRSRVASAPLSEPLFRVLRLALVTHLSAERADHTALRRPRQPAPESAETHGRGSFGARLRRRDLGHASLLGLEVADERLQSSRRLGELAHHPLVVRALVADLRQQDAALGGVPIDFALLTLGIRPERRQLPLPGLFPAAAILQTF